MTTVGAIDCGTNSIKVLVMVDGRPVLRESRVVRLGQGVDVTGELAEEALTRTFVAVEEFAGILSAHGVTPDRLRFCATSATRDSHNAQVFVDGVRERLGATPEVLSGDEEAALVYAGATAFGERQAEPVLVVDIGGGSTELVLGEGGAPVQSVSLDIGSVRLHERHLHDDPPTAEQVAAALVDIDAALDRAPVDVARAASVIGTSGTIKTLAAGVLALTSYDRERIDGVDLRVDETLGYVDAILEMSVERRRALPFMHPGRADVIGAGALIWMRVLERSGVETYHVSEADILHGIALGIA